MTYLTNDELKRLINYIAQKAEYINERHDVLNADDLRFQIGLVCGATMLLNEMITEKEECENAR